MTHTEEKRGELLFLQYLPCLRFEADIWPSLKGVSILMARDVRDFARGGHTMMGPMEIAREYFSEWEAIQPSIYRELLGVHRCLQVMEPTHKRAFVVLHMDAASSLGIVNRGSPKLIINDLAMELFWFCLRHCIIRKK